MLGKKLHNISRHTSCSQRSFSYLEKSAMKLLDLHGFTQMATFWPLIMSGFFPGGEDACLLDEPEARRFDLGTEEVATAWGKQQPWGQRTWHTWWNDCFLYIYIYTFTWTLHIKSYEISVLLIFQVQGWTKKMDQEPSDLDLVRFSDNVGCWKPENPIRSPPRSPRLKSSLVPQRNWWAGSVQRFPMFPINNHLSSWNWNHELLTFFLHRSFPEKCGEKGHKSINNYHFGMIYTSPFLTRLGMV